MNASMLIGVLAFAAMGGAAAAETSTTTVLAPSHGVAVERVQIEPSMLNDARGIQVLKSRVRRAAHRVCESAEDGSTAQASELRCYGPAVTNGLVQVDRAIHAARTSQPVPFAVLLTQG